MTNDNGLPYRVGEWVRVNKPGLREHRTLGVVYGYDHETQWYLVELDRGPPWRGRYESGELTPA